MNRSQKFIKQEIDKTLLKYHNTVTEESVIRKDIISILSKYISSWQDKYVLHIREVDKMIEVRITDK